MCTVSYIPKGTGYILTVNRDESPERGTLPPQYLVMEGGKRIVAPRDVLKGGTWVALDENGRVACLLNGAFNKHKRQTPYRRSRGQYVLDAIGAEDFRSFISGCQLNKIEPFTMLLITPGEIHKLVWDGTRKYSWELPAATIHLWSSPTLYTSRQHSEKERYFKDNLSFNTFTTDELLKIHGLQNETPFLLKRPEVGTVSIAQVLYSEGKASFTYHTKENYYEDTWFGSAVNL